MICPECTSHILDDCHYCPKCGKPTPLSAERSAGTQRPAPPVGYVAPGTVAPPVVQEMATPAATPESVAAPAVHPPLAPKSAAPSPPSDPRVINNLLTQANLSRVRGNWSEAIDRCVEVLQAEPGNAAAHALLGDIYAARERYTDAAQWYRMALEIHPNPIDEAKLSRTEREIAQQETQKAKSVRRISVDPAVQPTDGQAQVGTVALMGVSPRLWLRGITVASFAFLVVSGAILLGTQNRHPQDGKSRPLGDPNQVNSIAPPEGTLGSLPPIQPNGPTIVPPGGNPNEVSPPHVGGSGLAPDTITTARTVPTGASQTRQPGTNNLPGMASRNMPSVATAPIEGVRPMPRNTDNPGFSTLSGGMKLAKMASVTNTDEVVLVLANAPTSNGQDYFRQNAIRNVYRAARNAFATNGEAKQASVYIQTDLTERGGAVLMEAHVDRDSALKSDPDGEQPDSLLNHLTSVKWGP
ncbi:MAG: hypothetical protein JWN14_1876 [Chthonomonadales bacterium]|nr:hypothetical protein [Chthonomonadales bacterium]